MALFIDVARGSPRVAERRAWLEPYMATDSLAEYIAEGLFAEDAYWAGDLTGALTAVKATIGAATAWGGEEYGPQVIRPAAVGIAALADQARHARAAGQPADALVAEAADLAEIARQGLDSKRRARPRIGVDGRGWLARAEAELKRAADDNAPDNWRAVVDTFGAGFRVRGGAVALAAGRGARGGGRPGRGAAAVAARRRRPPITLARRDSAPRWRTLAAGPDSAQARGRSRAAR